jgi:hypothetical protein
MFENVSVSEYMYVLKFRKKGMAQKKYNSWRALERCDNVLGGDSESELELLKSYGG